MSESKDSDEALGSFLRKHAAAVPPAPPQLEEALITRIGRDELPVRKGRWPQFIWGLALAVASLLIWMGRQEAFEPPATPDSVALEHYMEDSWDGAIEGGQELSHESMLVEIDRDL